MSHWLKLIYNSNDDNSYRHFHLVEDPNLWEGVKSQILDYFKGAHADAIERVNNLLSDSLHPINSNSPSPLPATAYPCALPLVTKQGYFGEIMSAYLAEAVTPKTESWKVPAHLFRFHLTAFQFLETLSQTGNAPSAVVGRTGDDCLAFIRNENGKISSILFCEAKCTLTHKASHLADAHDKAANSAIIDILQLIEILKDRNTSESASWIEALRELYFKLNDGKDLDIERQDAVCYVHAQIPIKNSTWVKTDSVHASYTADRKLNVFEVRLADVEQRINDIYSPGEWT